MPKKKSKRLNKDFSITSGKVYFVMMSFKHILISLDIGRKLTEEAVDCLVELESDKLMIEETFANINFSQLGGSHDDGMTYCQ